MTDPDRIDELASAHLDGVSISDDPVVIARAGEFEHARAALRSVAAVDATRCDRIVDAALTAAVVVAMRRRKLPFVAGAAVAGAAAAVLALAIGLHHGSSGTNTASDRSLATSAASKATVPQVALGGTPNPIATSAAPFGSGAYSTAAAATSAPAAAALPPSPLAIASADQLAAAYHKVMANSANGPTTSLPPACPVTGTFAAFVTYQSTPAEMWVMGTGTNRSLLVVARSDCRQLVQVPLP